MTQDSSAFAWIEVIGELAETRALGSRIAAGLAAGDCVALEGDLGAGKTTLARAILKALGVEEYVPSPTFMLVQDYLTTRLPVRHIDLYRVENASEVDELGLDDALAEGAVLIEWPGRAGDRLPADALHVALQVEKGGLRSVTISGPRRWERFLLGATGHGN